MTSLKKAVFIIVDVETTGLHPVKKDGDKDDFVPDRVVEIAAGQYIYGKELKMASSLIDPEMKIPSRTSAVHHIIDEDVKGKPSFEQYASRLYKRIPENAIIVAHNASFDSAFLKPAGGIDIAKERTWICSLRLSRLLFKDLDSYANQALRYELNLDVPRNIGAHHAGDDVLITSKVLEKEIEAYLELGHDDDIEAFVEFASSMYEVKCFPNGKYREQSIEEMAKKDISYLRWYRDNMDIEEDVIASVRNAIKGVEEKNNASKPTKKFG